MAFTIQVKKRTVGEDFTFSDLVLLHEECVGGRINTKFDDGYMYWKLTCSRCNMRVDVDVAEEGTVAIVKTAIDGKRRELKVSVQGTAGVIAVQCE